ncbi:unnamed protein product [Didymodactylos carnosus]|uniref:EF-hand domain-containing protein n=1 Tax=Didymodactylos carnosus TaxID=1234261 RepID=A0A814XZ99_9BILA|nr:unnamed protein product [Didymodactylos carnosus]CAF1503397.1 unnamed protein product [Didymodactylos carnosus]CAF3985619.1 unnamed protein product [Didymodactylos carnosus]CAF4291754.1 unnamed protein product [Didymodactylos carnosus]
MGNRQERPQFQQWDLSRLQQVTGLPQEQLLQLYNEFRQSAGADGLMDRNEFRALRNRISPQPGAGFQQQHSTDQIFRAFDRDNSGSLTFDEFVAAIVMLNQNASQTQKWNYIIDQYNPGGIGHQYIQPQYAQSIFHSANQLYGTNIDYNQAWNQLDQQGQGYVTRDELINYVNQHMGGGGYGGHSGGHHHHHQQHQQYQY